ncbi:MAG: hypothetical protein AAF993_02855 [Pseudomonadota bacterium]
MRFDSARAAGLYEAKAELVADGYADVLAPGETAALQLTDALIGLPGPLSEATVEKLQQHYSAAELVEISLGVGLFMGMSKVLITLGLEPADEMPVTLLPTPGSLP